MEKEKHHISREAADITLRRVKKYEDLDASTEEERERIFKEKTLELWDRFVVHGVLNSQTGRIDTFTDLDGRGALGLLRRAGILDPKNYVVYSRAVEKKPYRSEIMMKTVEGQSPARKKSHKILSYVAAGETLPGAIHLDTGNKEGVISDEDASAFFDHHGPKSGLDSSATKKVYETLLSLGLLEQDEALEKTVEFITMMDNGTFPEMEKYFMSFHQTVLGLERYIRFESLYQFFKDVHQPADLLSYQELKKYGLDKASEKQEFLQEKAKQEFRQLERDGFLIGTKVGGKALIVVGRRFSGGYLGAKHFGAKVYIIWSPAEGSFFISNNEENLPLNLSQGENIRGKMWIKPRHDKEPLKISLKDIIGQVAAPDFIPQGELAEYLKNS